MYPTFSAYLLFNWDFDLQMSLLNSCDPRASRYSDWKICETFLIWTTLDLRDFQLNVGLMRKWHHYRPEKMSGVFGEEIWTHKSGGSVGKGRGVCPTSDHPTITIISFGKPITLPLVISHNARSYWWRKFVTHVLLVEEVMAAQNWYSASYRVPSSHTRFNRAYLIAELKNSLYHRPLSCIRCR